MPHLTVRQAAERVGISRQTMFRHIKQGRVSATTSHSGEKQIEVTELLRAYGALQPETVKTPTTSDRQRQSHREISTPTTVAYQIELEKLRAQLEIKTVELSLAKERIAELKTREVDFSEEKNRLLTLVEQQSRLLAAPLTTPQIKPNTKQKITKAKSPTKRVEDKKATKSTTVKRK